MILRYYKYLLILAILIFKPICIQAQYRTIRSEIPSRKHSFEMGLGLNEYFTDTSYTFYHPVSMIYTPNPRVQIFVNIPFITSREIDAKHALTSFGDVYAHLNVRLKKRWIPLKNESIKDLKYIANFLIAFNMPTGPKKLQNSGAFFPHSKGAFDMRIGGVWSFSFYNFGIYLNLIYAYAAYYNEKYLPFKGFGKPPEKSYVLNIHKVIGKFIWPFHTIENEYWWKDDFITYNIAIYTSTYFKMLLFKYRFFVELNGIQTFKKYSYSKYCLYGNSLDITMGLWIKLTKNFKFYFCYMTPIFHEARTYYYKNMVSIFLITQFGK